MKVKTLTTTAIVCLLLAGRALSAYAQNVYANVERKTGDMVSLQVAANQRISFAADGDYVLGTYHGPYVTFTGQNVYKSVARTATMPQGTAAGACFGGRYYQFTPGGYAVYDLTTGESVKSLTTLSQAADITFGSVDFAGGDTPVAYATGSTSNSSNLTVKAVDVENDAVVHTYGFSDKSGGAVAAWDFDGGQFWVIDYASTPGDAPYTVQQYQFSEDAAGYTAQGSAVTVEKSASVSGELGDCKYLNGHIYILTGNSLQDYDVTKGAVVATIPTASQATALALVPEQRRFVTTGADGWTDLLVAPFAYEANESQKQVVSITKTDGTTFTSSVDCLENMYYSETPATLPQGVKTYEGSPLYFGESYFFKRKKLAAAPSMDGAAMSQSLNGTTYTLSSNGTISFGDYKISTGLTGASQFLVDADSRKFVVAAADGTYDVVFDGTFMYIPGASGEINLDSLTLARANWNWQTVSSSAQYGTVSFPSLFNSAQTISIVKYPESALSSSLVHKPGQEANGTDKLAAAAGATVAINGSYFDMSTFEPVTALWYNGAMQCEGGKSARCTGIVAFKDGKIDFDKYDYETTTSEELAAWQSRYDAFMVSGHLLRLKGVEQSPFVADSQAFDGVNPRSMIGVTSDRTVYMVVVDGRQSGKADGLTIPQMAQLAKYLGLVDAINLDGGGSSTLWVKGKGVINTPSGGSVRKVPNIIIAK